MDVAISRKRHGGMLSRRDACLGCEKRRRDAGVDFALNMVEEIRDSRAIEGVHLVPVTRTVQVAERLRVRG